MSYLDVVADALWPTRPTSWRELPARLIPVFGNIAKLTAASVAAYAITREVVDGPIDLTAALTAMLVMQASAARTVKKGLLRVVAVGSGVSLALGATYLFGMHWWSLALVVSCALVLAKILRLGDSALEMPISAMLILGQGTDVAAETRVVATLIGVTVGVLLPLVLPPSIPYRSAASAVRKVGADQRALLVKAADAMEQGPITRARVADWSDRARTLTGNIANAHDHVVKLTDVRKYNSRAMGRADIAPILTSGLHTLESCLLSLRWIFMAMEREVPAPMHPSLSNVTSRQPTVDDHAQAALAVVLRRFGECLQSFAAMVEAEANGNEEKAHEAFTKNYRRLRDARSDLSLLMDFQDPDSPQWLLRGGILPALDQALQQLDIDSRVRVRERWKASQLGRRLEKGQIGPRTNPLDRARHARMLARQLRRPAPPPTEEDFLDDDRDTQPIPVVTPEILAAEPRPRRRLRKHRR
ncbi:aromatic acid exporter family protein [Luteococcus sediminum]